MVDLQWALDVGQAIQNLLVDSCSAASNFVRNLWSWVLQPQQKDHPIYSIIKWIVYILVGVALTMYIGWKGIELAQAGLRISGQSNGLSAKQICNGDIGNNPNSSIYRDANQKRRT
jgi:hypothetical protein